jgi:hypothetical protein
VFKKKNVALLMAIAALVAACGGGGGSDDVSDTRGANNGTPPAPVTSGDTGTGGGANNGGGMPPANTGNPPSTSDPVVVTNPSSDQQLSGHFSVVGNQLVYIRTDRSIYNAVQLNQFESDTGMYDFASGSKVATPDVYVPAPAVAPAAPIAALGFRVDKIVQPSTAGQAVGSQTVVGRVALSFTERDTSPGILANEVAERMSFVIDKVELSTAANGELTKVRVLDGAQMHVSGRSASGLAIQETIPVPADAVRLLPISNVLDHYGDNSSVVLLMDLETAFSQAGQKLTALENIAGHFSMNVTLSSVKIVRPAAAETFEGLVLERKDLIGKAITVNNQPPVSGAGVSGNAWIRMYPPQAQ